MGSGQTRPKNFGRRRARRSSTRDRNPGPDLEAADGRVERVAVDELGPVFRGLRQVDRKLFDRRRRKHVARRLHLDLVRAHR